MNIPELLRAQMAQTKTLLEDADPKNMDEHLNVHILERLYLHMERVQRSIECTQSSIEAIVMMRLSEWEEATKYTSSPIKVTPHAQIGECSVVDFLVEWNDYKIVIECGGRTFDEQAKEQIARERRRDRYLAIGGFTILRYTGHELVEDRMLPLADLFGLCIEQDERLAELLDVQTNMNRWQTWLSERRTQTNPGYQVTDFLPTVIRTI